MSQPVIEPPILDEPMIEQNTLPNIQEKSMTNHPTISYKIPQDNQNNPIVPLKIKQVYKAKEKVVEQPTMVPFVPPLREEKKLMVDKLAPTQTQIDNRLK